MQPVVDPDDPVLREAAAQLRGRPGATGIPTWLVAVAGVVLATNAVTSVWGALTIGVSTDEPTHVSRLQTFLDHGWYLPSAFMLGGVPQDRPDVYDYGPVTALLGHAAAVLSGAEDWGTASELPSAYAARHAVTALTGLGGLAAVFGIGRLLWGWRLGVVAAAVTSAIPMWTGHSMFNLKDVPVATGYTLVTLGLVVLAARGDPARGSEVAGVAAVVGGVGLTIGTRPGMWPALGLSVAVAIGLSAASQWRRSGRAAARSAALRTAGLASAGGAGGLLLLAAVYPAAFLRPWNVAIASVQSSADFQGWDGEMLTAGLLHGMPPPWYYQLAWFGHQIPVLLLLLSLLGLVTGLVRLLQRAPGAATDGRLAVGFCLVVLQATAVPVFAVVRQSAMYGGVRQVLFVVPALGVLAALGVAWLRPAARAAPWGTVVGVGVAAALVLPTVDQVRLFPYGYTYFNELASVTRIDGRWPTDYWRTSLVELAGRAGPPPADLRVSVVDQVNTTGSAPPAGCRTVAEVTRPLRWQSLVMSARYSCPAPPYPPGGIDFREGGTGTTFVHSPIGPPGPLGAWTRTDRLVVAAAVEDTGALRVTVRVAAIRGYERPLAVVVGGNGRELRRLRLTPGSHTLAVTVPETVTAAGDGTLVLDLRIGPRVHRTLDNPWAYSPNGLHVTTITVSSLRPGS